MQVDKPIAKDLRLGPEGKKPSPAYLLITVAMSMLLIVLVGCLPFTRDDRPSGEEWTYLKNQSKPNLNPVWTPDGSHIVFSRYWSRAEDGTVYVVSADGSDFWRLLESEDEGDYDHSPSLSPDGVRVAYATSRLKTADFLRNYEIETSALDGSDRRRLTENSSMDISPAWSPDGSRIAFLAINYPVIDHIDSGIYIMAPDGSDVRPVVVTDSIEPQGLPDRYVIQGRFLGIGPVWSPDGGGIAFTVGLSIHSPEDSLGVNRRVYLLYTVAADGSGLVQIFPRALSSVVPADESGLTLARLFPDSLSINLISRPSWSPDGRQIAFVMYGYDDQRDPQVDLYTVRSDGSDLRKLAAVNSTSLRSGPSWSPDGSEILVETTVIAADGSAVRRLPGGDYASWSPDGSRIAIVNAYSAKGYNFEKDSAYLSTVAPDGSDRQVLVRIDEDGGLKAAR